MVVLQKSDNQLSAEIVRNLKQNFKPKRLPAHPHNESKVRIRTNCYYKSELKEDNWRNKYNRRITQSYRGFYTPAHVPYASVGDVCLDVRGLVVSTVGCDQSSEKSKNLNFVADLHEKEKRKEEERDAAHQKKSHEPKKLASPSSQGGLQEIKDKLLRCNQRLAAMRAGQSFQDCLLKEHIISEVLEAMREYRNAMQEPCVSPNRIKKIFNKMRPVERSEGPTAVDESELIPSLPSEINSEHEEENSDQKCAHDRCIRHFSSKLHCFYTLLCYLYHLRTRDLRTKVPLTREYLKTLKTDVLTDHKGRPLRQTRNMANAHPLSRGAHQRSSTDTSRLEPEYHTSPHMNTRSSFVGESPSNLFRVGLTTGNGAIESRASFLGRKIRTRDTSDKIDTRENLLEAGDKPPPNLQVPCTKGGPTNEPGGRGGITRSSFLHALKMVYSTKPRRYGVLHHIPHHAPTNPGTEHLPIWHQVATAERNAKDDGPTGVLSKRRSKRSTSKIASSLSDLIEEGFTKIQATAAQGVKDRLTKIDRRENDSSFVKKVITFQPSSLFKVDLERVEHAGYEATEEYDKDDVNTARWYGALEEEAQELGVRKEPEVVMFFDKLYPFAMDDVTTLPFVQAKLCLLLQSLPVHELCPVVMQEAFLFLIMRVLGSTSSVFNEWMNHRKLPPVRLTR